MTTKRDRAAAAAFFNDQPEWDLTIAHWIETGEKRYGATHLARPDVIALADAFAAHAAGEVEEVGIQLVALQARPRADAAIARADAAEARALAAEQMVAEMRDVLEGCVRMCGCKHPACRFCDEDAAVADALALSAPIAGRWCLASERDAADARADAAIARAEAAEAREWALGVQVVAQAARLKQANGLAVAVREYFTDGDIGDLFDALAAYDAVPGDDLDEDLDDGPPRC